MSYAQQQAAALIQEAKVAAFEKEVETGLQELIQQRLSAITETRYDISESARNEYVTIRNLLNEKYLPSLEIEVRVKQSKIELNMLLSLLKELRRQSRNDSSPEIKELIDGKQAEYTAALDKYNAFQWGHQQAVDAERKYRAYDATKAKLSARLKHLTNRIKILKNIEAMEMKNIDLKEKWRHLYTRYTLANEIEGYKNLDEMIYMCKDHAISHLPFELYNQVKYSDDFNEIDFISRTYDYEVDFVYGEDGIPQPVNTLIAYRNPLYC